MEPCYFLSCLCGSEPINQEYKGIMEFLSCLCGSELSCYLKVT